MSAPRRRDAGAYSATAGLLSPRRPARASSRTLWVLWTSRSGVAFRHPRAAILGPVRVSAPPLPCSSTPQDRNGGALFASRDRLAERHCCGSSNGDRTLQGLLDLHPPTGLPS